MRKWMTEGAAFGAALILVSMAGCGGSGGGNNDQGISFLATGTFRGQQSIEQNQITCVIPTVTSAIIDNSFTLNISLTREFPDPGDVFGDPCGGYIGLQNNLLSQGINVEEIAISYDVPGAGVAIPTHSVNVGQHIASASSTAGTPSGQANLIFLQLTGQIVPDPIIVFLNQNVNRLPATPYLMDVFMVARGQSDNSTNYQSNQIGYQLTITQR